MKFKQSLMENNSVLLNAAASDWRNAIKLGTDMLIRSGAVEPRYHDAIIGSIEKMGPYIVIAPPIRNAPCEAGGWSQSHGVCTGHPDYAGEI
ncbi:TPA: PTS sugar transporter subunit IIA [Aeromonas veronii]